MHLQDIDLIVENRALEWYSTYADDFLPSRGKTRLERALRQRYWSVRTTAHTARTSSGTEFRISANLEAYEGDKRVFCRSWDIAIPRDFV